ncbi:MAG: peptidylprolyl isomerase [Planctomycetia bacterium]|nr:peptidylprolyl isomerase [Planctomycetia bacterium]
MRGLHRIIGWSILFLGICVTPLAAQWWKSDKSSQDSSSSVTEISREQFESYSEAKNRQKEEAKSNKGFLIRFPWAKKEEEELRKELPADGKKEVADPFGPAQYPQTPVYQDLNALENPEPNSTVQPSTSMAAAAPTRENVAPLSPLPPQAKPSEETLLTKIPSLQTDTSSLSEKGIQFYTHGQTIAQVGSQVVLAGDIMDSVDRILEENKDKMPPEAVPIQREMIARAFLEQAVESKLIYCDILRTIPPEGLQKNIEMIDKLFESQELPQRMKKANVTLREDYEKLLESQGTTILKQKYLFREIVLCQQWLQQSITVNEDVSPAEVMDYYREHLQEFETPPKARWEELVVRKSRFHSREDAYREIIRIGSMVAVQGKPFAEVAREFSHKATSMDGGQHDWIQPGELASKPLENAVFSQPVGQLSENIIEDDDCFYIIRVLERQDLIRKPFVDAQVEIKEKIVQQKKEEGKQEYLDRLRKEIPVLTIFDGIPTPEERMKNAQKSPASQNPWGQL